MYIDDSLQRAIEERQKELHRIAEIAGRNAKDVGRRASITKTTTIVLGALVATNAVAKEALPGREGVVAVVYAALGVAIAALNGLDAAFKNDTRSGQMKSLGA